MTSIERPVLIVDDSPYARRALKTMIEEALPDAAFVYAGTGDEALSAAIKHQPGLIILDLEMPRMDGFTFLRLLMAERPVPVIVVSAQHDRKNVLKALELGALDFIAKPASAATPRLYEIAADLREKITVLDQARVRKPTPPSQAVRATRRMGLEPAMTKQLPQTHVPPRKVIVVGASTGGPGTLSFLLANMRLADDTSLVVAQHMPPGYTEAFAHRLDHALPYPVREIRNLDRVEAGSAYICPGGRNTLISQTRDLRFRVVPGGDSRYLPSVDVLFRSAADALQRAVAGVILTGMGNDGAEGCRAIASSGGVVLVEDPGSAIVPGMPAAALATETVDGTYSVDELSGALEQWSLGILRQHP